MIDASRKRIAAALTILGLLLASLGGGGVAGGLSPASAATAHFAKKKHHAVARKPAKKKSCIPQTAKHTDNDPDNDGGPNDGDGCV